MRVVASIEARMGASRLPGKVLADICGRPALGHMLDRVRLCRQLDDIVVATSESSADTAISEWCRKEGVNCYRGSESDVLGRVLGAQRWCRSDVVVELCGDCPLLEPTVVDAAVEAFAKGVADVVTTTRRESFPAGVDVEVFSCEALQWVACHVEDVEVREHVSLYFYQHPERYRIHDLAAPEKWRHPAIRLLLDYPEDLDFLRALISKLDETEAPHGLDTVLAMLRRHPDIGAVNAGLQ